jgi:hypothetical protein
MQLPGPPLGDSHSNLTSSRDGTGTPDDGNKSRDITAASSPHPRDLSASAGTPASDESVSSEAEDEYPWEPLSNWMQQLSLDPRHSRDHGGTSTVKGLSMRVRDLMANAMGHAHAEDTRRPEFWRQHPVSARPVAIVHQCS